MKPIHSWKYFLQVGIQYFFAIFCYPLHLLDCLIFSCTSVDWFLSIHLQCRLVYLYIHVPYAIPLHMLVHTNIACGTPVYSELQCFVAAHSVSLFVYRTTTIQ